MIQGFYRSIICTQMRAYEVSSLSPFILWDVVNVLFCMRYVNSRCSVRVLTSFCLTFCALNTIVPQHCLRVISFCLQRLYGS
jgi:hypothetical protein